MPKIRVLIVDDTIVIRRLVSQIIEQDPDLEVAGVAANGNIALQKLTQVNPDVVTLDVEMPEMDGIETVKEIRKTHPNLPIIMFSSLTSRGAEATLECLDAGATDYVTKPQNVAGFAQSMDVLKEDLLPRIKSCCANKLVSQRPPKTNEAAALRKPIKPADKGSHPVGILSIGTSTGGPNALAKLFQGITDPLPVPIVIVQHMPPLFTKSLAQRLDRNSSTNFFEGEENQEIEPGCAYIAPGGKHMELRRDNAKIRIRLHEGPLENSCRPAVDPLFRSVAKCYGPTALALILTGMGQDGLRGCEAICQSGGVALAQDEATSVVWGMPGYIAEKGLAEEVLPLDKIAASLQRRIEASKTRITIA